MSTRFSDHNPFDGSFDLFAGEPAVDGPERFDAPAGERAFLEALLAQAAADSPLARPGMDVYVPDAYEPGYAYPLIVWVHTGSGRRPEIDVLMPQISERNYFGLSLRAEAGTDCRAGGWPEEQLCELEQRLYDDVCQVRGEFHIHSERIYLAGLGDAGTLAVQLMLRRPEWFEGAAGFGARLPAGRSLLGRFRDLPGKRVLLGNAVAPDTHRGQDPARLLHAAGVSVALRNYATCSRLLPEMLRDINAWVMDGVCAANLV